MRGRVRFEKGVVQVLPVVKTGEDPVVSLASFVSPGTELRHLAMTRTGPSRFAGYMNVTTGPGRPRVIEPIPHGAAYVTGDSRALEIDQDLSLEVIAVSRFQLIAALGLSLIGERVFEKDIVVFGSGPVAVGCVLELVRLQQTNISVITQNPKPACALISGVRIQRSVLPQSASIVIDCTGDVNLALTAVKKGGVVGLLGTPAEQAQVETLALHRQGIQLFGLHELVPPPALYCSLFNEVMTYVAASLGADILGYMSERWPGESAPRVYEQLCSPARAISPFLILEW